MKKYILMFTLLVHSTLIHAKDPLAGKVFTICDKGDEITSQYWIGFFKGGEKFTAQLFFESKKNECEGKELFAIGRTWNYEIKGNEIVSTLVVSKVILFSREEIRVFNANKFCGIQNWKLNQPVDCTGHEIYGLEERTGYTTMHQFKTDNTGIELKDYEGEVQKLINSEE